MIGENDTYIRVRLAAIAAEPGTRLSWQVPRLGIAQNEQMPPIYVIVDVPFASEPKVLEPVILIPKMGAWRGVHPGKLQE